MTSYQAAAIVGRVRRFWPEPEHAVLVEVADQTGPATRRADVCVFGLWPSRGLHLHVIEIKVSRRDWLRELRNPAKMDQIGRYADKISIAATPDVVTLDELPDGWGLYETTETARGLRQVRKPDLRDSLAWPRTFVMSCIRSVVEQRSDEAQIRDEVNRRVAELTPALRKDAAARAKAGADTEYRLLRDQVDRFEAASGVQISRGWAGPKLGEAIEAMSADPGGPAALVNMLTRRAETFAAAAETLQAAAAALISRPSQEEPR